MRKVYVLPAALLASFAAVAPAAAQRGSLAVAREHYENARFPEAIAELDEVLSRSDVEVATVVDAHRYLAALHQIAGHPAEARSHALAAVALDPMSRAPEGAPPEVRELLDGARRELGDRRPAIRVGPDGEARSGEDLRVTARVEHAVGEVFRGLTLACGSAAGGEVEADGPPEGVSLVVPRPTGVARCRAAALSAGLSVLLSERTTIPLDPPAGEGPDPLLLGIGIAGGAVVVGVAIALIAVFAGGDGQAHLGAPDVVSVGGT